MAQLNTDRKISPAKSSFGRIVKTLLAAGTACRPRQWIKNLALVAPAVFTGQLFVLESIIRVALGVITFSLVSSANYLINDVRDLESDKLHPTKKNRPIARGDLGKFQALIFAAVLASSGLILAYYLNLFFAISATVFLFLGLSYSMLLKRIILLDILAIGLGFLLRVYAGAVVIDAHVTVWFLLTVTSLSLFLAIGKRRSERTLLKGEAGTVRSTLLHYPDSLLDSLTAMFAASTWLTYALFTFLEPLPQTSPQVLVLLGENLPRTFFATKFLMITIPFVIYGLMRYLFLIYEKKEGESPEKILISDKPLLITCILWFLLVVFVIYGLNKEFISQILR